MKSPTETIAALRQVEELTHTDKVPMNAPLVARQRPLIEPRDVDVVLGRGRKVEGRPGNQAFQAIVRQFIPLYGQAINRKRKKQVTLQVLNKALSLGIRFLRWNDESQEWEEADAETIRIRVGQSFRYMMKNDITPNPIPIQASEQNILGSASNFQSKPTFPFEAQPASTFMRNSIPTKFNRPLDLKAFRTNSSATSSRPSQGSTETNKGSPTINEVLKQSTEDLAAEYEGDPLCFSQLASKKEAKKGSDSSASELSDTVPV